MSDSLKPNILFIVLDGLRSDKFYGSNKTSVTPYLDDLIKSSALEDLIFSILISIILV